MPSFHIIVRGRAPGNLDCRADMIQGVNVETLIVPSQLQSPPMEVSFEEAACSLEALPRMFLEPDGSFVWVAPVDEQPAWQIDGNLVDRSGRVVGVELKGNGPREVIERLLMAFRGNASRLMFELVQHAVFLDEDEFWRFHSSGSHETLLD